MLCHKVHNWLSLEMNCPHEYDCQDKCNSVWVTLIGGTGVQVCPSCKLFIYMNGYAEKGQENVKEKKSKSKK